MRAQSTAVRRVVAFAATALALAGCGSSGEGIARSEVAEGPQRSPRHEQPERPARSEQPPAPPRETADQEAIDRLRTLPYAAVVDDEAPPPAPGESAVIDPERVHPGYTLYSVRAACLVALVDLEGDLVRTWGHPCHRWSNAELLGDGDLLVVGTKPRPEDARESGLLVDDLRVLLRFSFDGELEWSRQLTIHHDIERTPRGDLIALTYRRVTRHPLSPDADLRDDQITMLDEEGRAVESLSMLEMIEEEPGVFPLEPVEKETLGLRRYLDLFHANAVEWMPHEHLAGTTRLHAPSNVIVSFRHQNRVAIFNWEREELVWAWGRDELLGPHDAKFLSNGNVLVFDNGLGRGWSRVIELDPVEREIVWEYRAPDPESFYTAAHGSAQRLPNGNTLIAESDSGRGFEVTPAGRIVWEHVAPFEAKEGKRSPIVRMKRYPTRFIERLLDE